jgi:hydroxyacylglutathione hydrolase
VEETGMMTLERFEAPGLAHYSYVVSSRGVAAVVDPKRDVDTYIAYAATQNLKISHILETHIHADYASGARELAARTGAEMWLSGHDTGEDFEYAFAHHEFRDGDLLQLGDVKITALHTPGHTPEHLSFLLHDPERGEAPQALLSGDFLFVGSLGRPDLLGEAAKRKLAEQLYDSLYTRVASLPDSVEVYPAHGAGSMCGAGMGDQPRSTLGNQRRTNVYFGLRDRAKFIEHILANVPPFPDYYRRMKRVNSAGPQVFDGLPGSAALTAQEVAQATDAVVIDLRRPEDFGAGHIPGAFSIGAGPLLAMWSAWVVPYDRPIVLVGEENTPYEEARRALIRVGLDDVRGRLAGGMPEWVAAGYDQAQLPQISVEELGSRLTVSAASAGATGSRNITQDVPLVLDVRTQAEWNSGHIASARHIMGGDLPARVGELPKETPIHVICASGYRSSIATSVLRRAGFRRVSNITGGMTAWRTKGLPTV